MRQQLEEVYRDLALNNYAVIVGARRTTQRALQKAAAAFRPTNEAEARLASLFTGAQLWSFFRRHGIEPNNLPRKEQQPFMESVAMEWAGRFVDEHRELGFNRDRVRMRLLLHDADRTGVFGGTGGLRSGMENFAKDGATQHLDNGARAARKGIEAAAKWAATIDVCAAVLGQSDSQVVEHRQRLERDMAELDDMLKRARPLLVDHGLAGDLYPDGE